MNPLMVPASERTLKDAKSPVSLPFEGHTESPLSEQGLEEQDFSSVLQRDFKNLQGRQDSKLEFTQPFDLHSPESVP